MNTNSARWFVVSPSNMYLHVGVDNRFDWRAHRDEATAFTADFKASSIVKAVDAIYYWKSKIVAAHHAFTR